MSKAITDYSDRELSAYLCVEFESMNLQRIDKALGEIDAIGFESFADEFKCLLYYNIANGWSYKEQLSREEPDFRNETIGKQIYYTRLALLNFHAVSNRLKSNILTNLGNLYSRLGRFHEAVKMWHQAIEYTPDFGMAIGNLGMAIYNYGAVVYEQTPQILYLHTSYHKLRKSCASGSTQENAKELFQQIIDSIEVVNSPTTFDRAINYRDILKEEPIENVNYRRWCIDNTLVLNFVNDITKHDAAAYDSLYLPTMTIRNIAQLSRKEPFFLSMFNEIKQQYASVRYFVYKGLERDTTHFSDKNNFLVDTMDNSNHSYNIELMKSGFKQCYSILDKIAYFIHEYLGLSGKKANVSFKSVWFEKNNVRDIFNDSANFAFRALFWMSKDLNYSREGERLNPEAEIMAKLRNYMEHRSLKIVDDCCEVYTTDDELTLIISRQDFAQKSIGLLNFVRAAIINLMVGIHIYEQSSSAELNCCCVERTYTSLEDEDKL